MILRTFSGITAVVLASDMINGLTTVMYRFDHFPFTSFLQTCHKHVNQCPYELCLKKGMARSHDPRKFGIPLIITPKSVNLKTKVGC